jgi:transposase
MNLPIELVDVLNWRDIGPSEKKQPILPDVEASVDQFISSMYPAYKHMIQFGVDYHSFMDNNDPAGLIGFIEKYKDDSYWRLAKFAKGLQMDLEAVKNTLLYPDISNGVVEGINSNIKCDKRVCGGKAKIDLLTAKILIRQINKATKVKV